MLVNHCDQKAHHTRDNEFKFVVEQTTRDCLMKGKHDEFRQLIFKLFFVLNNERNMCEKQSLDNGKCANVSVCLQTFFWCKMFEA